jgi:hypothetical protein
MEALILGPAEKVAVANATWDALSGLPEKP